MSDPIVSLLDKIVEIGDRLCTAITTREIDAVRSCLEERAKLLNRLEQHEDVVTEHPRWNAVNEELARQHDRIQKAFDAYRHEIEAELEEITGYKEAQSAYTEREEPSRQILNREVRG